MNFKTLAHSSKFLIFDEVITMVWKTGKMYGHNGVLKSVGFIFVEFLLGLCGRIRLDRPLSLGDFTRGSSYVILCSEKNDGGKTYIFGIWLTVIVYAVFGALGEYFA